MHPLLPSHAARWVRVGILALCLCPGAGRGGRAALSPAAPTAPRRVEQVIVAFKTHFDLGYTDMASNVVQRYRTTMIDAALEVADQNQNLPPAQQFTWMMPGWPFEKIVEPWPGHTPDRRERVLRALQRGRFAVHALPFTTHTELLEPEELVRGLTFASRASRAVGLSLPRDAKMTDVPCHSWVLPTLLRHAGVDFLHLGCNAASASPEVPRLFWWEGPDGSRLLTMYTAESYGTGLVPPADWPCRTWLALVHTGDNHGPPRPEEVRHLLAEAKAKLPGMAVRIGRLSDFADAILAERPDLPVVRADMPDTWIHGPMCDPAGAQLARTTRPLIAATELLGTTERFWNEAAPLAGTRPSGAMGEAPEATALCLTNPVAWGATLARAYEQSLLYGEHTWGGALYWVTSYSQGRRYPYGAAWRNDRDAGRFARLESSWEEHTDYIRRARALVAPRLDEQLGLLAAGVALEGPRAVVFNPLPWTRSGLVTVPAADTAWTSVRAVDGGPALPVQREGTNLTFAALDIPASGYRTYAFEARDLGGGVLRGDAARGELENWCFRVGIDPARGTIRSLRDKVSARELVAADAPHQLGQYLYERFSAREVQEFVRRYVKISADWATNELGKPDLPPPATAPYRAASPAGGSLRIEESPVAVTAIYNAPAGAGVPHPTSMRIALYADRPYLDLELTLHDKPADPWPEAGWLCLPFAVAEPRFRLGRLGGIIDPAADVVAGANHHLYALHTGTAVLDRDGYGVAFCALDNPLVSLGEPGCWRYARTWVPRQPSVYVNLFNNQWTTNFRLWNEGTWTARVRLWAVRGEALAEALVTPSLEARYPLQAATAQGRAGPWPLARAGLEVSRPGVLVTAFGPDPDGPGTVLRLWECAGRRGRCEVRLPEGCDISLVQPIDLRGRALGDPLPVSDRRFTVRLAANAPASFRIAR